MVEWMVLMMVLEEVVMWVELLANEMVVLLVGF